MADITSEKAIVFSQRVREVATALEQAYWLAKRLDREWNAQSMSSEITNTSDSVVDNDHLDKPLTGADVTSVITQCEAMVTTYEASSSAVLNVVVKASSLPLE